MELPPKSLPVRGCSFLARVGSHLQSLVLLILRLTWGWEIAESGWGHLHNVAGTAEHFQKWGVPLPQLNVYVSGLTELVGGSLLILGLATRVVSVPMVFNFIVAIVAAGRARIAEKFHSGFLAGWDSIIDDTAFPMLMMSLVLFAFGGGKISVDHILSRTVFAKCRHRDTPTPTMR